MKVKFAPTAWTLIKQEEFFFAKKEILNSFNYANSASAQYVYYDTNTIQEAQKIKRKLLDYKPFPNCNEAKLVFDLLNGEISNYRWRSSNDIWHIINNSTYRPDNVFARNNWELVFFRIKDIISYSFNGKYFTDFICLMELLNGEHTISQITSLVGHSIFCRELMSFFIENELVVATEVNVIDVYDIPEITFLGHASILLRESDEIVIIDPLYSPSLEEVKYYNQYFQIANKSSLILISHFHWDHLHFQTLSRIKKDKLIAVPRVEHSSIENPSLKSYLKAMGFTNVVEIRPFEIINLKNMKIQALPFYGESFGLNSHFDALTYLIESNGKNILGTVDACYDESGTMKDMMFENLLHKEIDFLFFGASNQRHVLPFMAAGLRHFSNELINRRDLIRYHPNINDIKEWLGIINVKYIIPYAEFILSSIELPDMQGEILFEYDKVSSEIMLNLVRTAAHKKWYDHLCKLNNAISEKMIFLQPVQGIRFDNYV